MKPDTCDVENKEVSSQHGVMNSAVRSTICCCYKDDSNQLRFITYAENVLSAAVLKSVGPVAWFAVCRTGKNGGMYLSRTIILHSLDSYQSPLFLTVWWLFSTSSSVAPSCMLSSGAKSSCAFFFGPPSKRRFLYNVTLAQSKSGLLLTT